MSAERKLSSLIFDLDGTLIDSAPSILSTFAAILDRAGIPPAVTLDRTIIGPPLRKTLALIAGSDDSKLLDRLAKDFMDHYDEVGVFETQCFEGIPALLDALLATGVSLHLCTNKRLIPTRRIVDHLGWSRRFASTYALDMAPGRFADKAALIAGQITDLSLDPATTAYIGDTSADAAASTANAIPFYYAAWGYGNVPREATPPHWIRAENPNELGLTLSRQLQQRADTAR